MVYNTSMNSQVKKLLGTGLSGGYGKGKYGKTIRSGFNLDTSDYSDENGTYHDEWAAHQNGGGQELVKLADEEMATRVYAGGTLDADLLQKIGLTDKDVTERLLFFLKQLGDKTRMDKEIELIEDKWKYSYKILEDIKEIPALAGVEKIFYGDSLVFVHFIINSPIR